MDNVFSDDFTRSNGAIGNGWSVPVGGYNVLNNKADPQVGGWNIAIRNSPTARADMGSSIQQVGAGTNTNFEVRAIVRDTGSGTHYVCASWSVTDTTVGAFALKRVNGATVDTLHSVVTDQGRGVTHYIAIQAVGTTLTFFLDGVEQFSAVDDQGFSGSYYGFGNSNSSVGQDNYNASDSEPIHLSCIPTTVDIGSAGNSLALTSDRGNWTPGTPGAPTFQESAGRIVSQVVNSSTTATLIYDAPSVATTFTIAETLNNDSVTLTAGGAGFWQLDEVLRRLGLYEEGDSIANYWGGLLGKWGTIDAWLPDAGLDTALDSLDASVELDTPLGTLRSTVHETFQDVQAGGTDLLNLLMEVLTLAYIIRKQATSAKVDLLTILGDNPMSLEDLRNELTGNTTTTLYDILTAIVPVDLSTIEDQLTAIRTVNDWTLGSVKTWIDNIRTVGNYTLGDVLSNLNAFRTLSNYTVQDILDAIGGVTFDDSDIISAINAVRGTGNPDIAGVLTAIGGVRGSGNPDIAGVLTAIGGVRGSGNPDIAAVLTAIGNLPTGTLTKNDFDTSIQGVLDQMSTDKQDILDAIDGITVPPPTMPYGLPKLYPGSANVTWGTSVPFTQSTEVVATMDGASITLTTVDPHASHYQVGSFSQYRFLGWYAFVNDEGAVEPWQEMIFNEQLVTPKSMTRAAGLLIYCRGATTGAVTPYTVKAAA